MSENEKRPSHIVYNVREGKKKDQSFWDRCGVAFEHGDRKGFNVELSSIPVDGRLTLRTPPNERPDRNEAAGERSRNRNDRSRDR